MWPNQQFSADLVSLTEEIQCSVIASKREKFGDDH